MVSSGIQVHIQNSHFLFGKGNGSSKGLGYSLHGKATDKEPVASYSHPGLL